jgi:uncharacterized LabA/DUF88 family protein
MGSYALTPGEPQPLKRWMKFVDGENFTIRGQEVLASKNMIMKQAEKRGVWRKDTFLWFPNAFATDTVTRGRSHLETNAIRAYYYTSVVGDDVALQTVQTQLRTLGFSPSVFKRLKGREKSKGVDVALTKDMLTHAFQNHYDVAMLMAGDGDYVPLIEELKHLGKRVIVAFFGEDAGLSPSLKLASDEFLNITEILLIQWKELNHP